MAGKEVITRRDLPHWYVPGAAHFVTYRLYGSLSEAAIEELRARKEILLAKKPSGERATNRIAAHKALFGIYDGWIEMPTRIIIGWLSRG